MIRTKYVIYVTQNVYLVDMLLIIAINATKLLDLRGTIMFVIVHVLTQHFLTITIRIVQIVLLFAHYAKIPQLHVLPVL